MDHPEHGLLASLEETPLERPGTVIGPYKLLEQLGEGGMGVVFKAFDVPHDRIVALKFLRTDGAVDAELIARFKNEGTRCAAVRHENVVRIYALGREEGALYIASEFIDSSI